MTVYEWPKLIHHLLPRICRSDSRESPDSRESREGSRTEPLFLRIEFGALRIANCRFEAIRESLELYENRGFL